MRTSTILLIGAFAAAAGAFLYSRTRAGSAAVASASTTLGDLAATVGDFLGISNRGLRDNNPGNIRRTSDAWKGALSRADIEAAGLKYDPEFVQFDSIQNGVRAFGHVIMTYSNKYGLDTVREIVSRYAPPSDGNDTESYIADVAVALQLDPRGYDTFDAIGRLPELAAAMMLRETGYTADITTIAAQVYS